MSVLKQKAVYLYVSELRKLPSSHPDAVKMYYASDVCLAAQKLKGKLKYKRILCEECDQDLMTALPQVDEIEIDELFGGNPK